MNDDSRAERLRCSACRGADALSAADALDAAAARVSYRPSVQPCGATLGAICILVARADDPLQAIAQAGVSLHGPSPGQTPTDGLGVAEFACRVPGSYRFNVTLPRSLADWRLRPYAQVLSVCAGQVALSTVLAAPVGRLALEIRTDAGELVDVPARVTVNGAATMDGRVERGRHDYGEVPCGDYTVSACVLGRFGSATVSVSGLHVAAGVRVVAQLVVRPLTWIEIELVDSDGRGVPGEEYLVIAPEGRELRGITDALGGARLAGLVPGTCRVSFPQLDRGDWEPA